MKISNFNVREKKKFVITEFGNNQNGSVVLALELAVSAHEAGAFVNRGIIWEKT